MRYALRIAQSIEKGYGRLDKFTYTRGLRSLVGLPLPDFLGIGPTKTGTTWLSENLRCHPGVYICKEKEAHYFNHKFNKSLRYYADKFRDGINKVKGDITPEYYGLPIEKIRFIKTIMPNVKLILFLRNPIDRGWSHAVMNFSLRNKKIQEVTESEVVSEFKKQPLFRLGGYTGILDAWYSVFPASQMYVGLYENIKVRPMKLLQEVFMHIGVSSNVDWSLFPYNEVIIPPVGIEYTNHDKSRGVTIKGYRNTSFSMPTRYKECLREMYRHDIESMQKMFDGEITKWLHT